MNRPSVEIIKDDHIPPRVLDILRDAEKRVTLVSPYNEFWTRLEKQIDAIVRNGVRVDVIYRAGKRNDAIEWLETLGPRVKVHAVENLHAKIYLNESSVLITSMNLLESSRNNSMEIGISINDEHAQDEVRKYVETLLQIAQRADEGEKTPARIANSRAKNGKPQSVSEGRSKYSRDGGGKTGDEASRPSTAKRAPKSRDPASSTRKPARRPQKKVAAAKPSIGGLLKDLVVVVTGGRCIRCKESISFDPDRPLCDDCFKSWKRYENWDYEEDHCHRCGADWDTSYGKPLCRPCYDQVAA